jgi:hypothetical protein
MGTAHNRSFLWLATTFSGTWSTMTVALAAGKWFFQTEHVLQSSLLLSEELGHGSSEEIGVRSP